MTQRIIIAAFLILHSGIGYSLEFESKDGWQQRMLETYPKLYCTDLRLNEKCFSKKLVNCETNVVSLLRRCFEDIETKYTSEIYIFKSFEDAGHAGEIVGRCVGREIQRQLGLESAPKECKKARPLK